MTHTVNLPCSHHGSSRLRATEEESSSVPLFAESSGDSRVRAPTGTTIRTRCASCFTQGRAMGNRRERRAAPDATRSAGNADERDFETERASPNNGDLGMPQKVNKS